MSGNNSRILDTDTLRFSQHSAKLWYHTIRLKFGMIQKLCLLAKTTTRNQFMLITYILFFTKLQKKANPRKWICPYWKTISQQFFMDMILVFYRYMQFANRSSHNTFGYKKGPGYPRPFQIACSYEFCV